MTTPRHVTLNNGNKAQPPRAGRQEPNKIRKGLDLIGEENLRSIVAMHMDTAFNHPDIKLKTSCQEFLVDRFVPKPAQVPHQTYVSIDFLSFDSLPNIKENEDRVLRQVSEGKLSLQEGEKLIAMITQARGTYEATEAMKLIEGIDSRLKENGM